MTTPTAQEAISKALLDFDGYKLEVGVEAIIEALHAAGFKIIAREPTRGRDIVLYEAAKSLADLVERSLNVGPITKDPSREARAWRELRAALDLFKAGPVEDGAPEQS